MKKLFLLALGAFAIGTEGYALAGLLPNVAADLNVSLALAGQLITAFSLTFALGSPLLAVATSRFERKRVLLVSMLAFGLFNVIAALVQDYAMLFIARLGMALAAAVFMPAASAYAVAVSPVARRGRALSIIFAGLTISTLVGVPLGVFVGQEFGWRSVFVLAALLSLLTLAGLWTYLAPSRSTTGSVTLGQRIAVARRPDVLGALSVTVLFMTGVFAIYTYIAPFLEMAAGLSGSAIAVVLFVFGVGATIGNLASGAISDRIGASRVVTVALLCLTVLFAVLSVAAETLAPDAARWVIVPVIGLWGLIGFSVPSAQQARLVAMSPDLAPVTLSLNASAGYLGVSLGALAGSFVVSHGAAAALGWVAAAGQLLASVVLAYTLRSRTADRRALIPTHSLAS